MCARQGDEWGQDLVGQLPEACLQLLIGEGYQVGATSSKVVGASHNRTSSIGVGRWVVGQKRAG
ncbi:MAG: hypothetical protein BWY79_01952 [Actinobacteria bacterium ADurb.Bin444]|nr:MAG: hypothetical protein BWY79_01952 [Actinobacteria bacterium ADurb.Bin444]